MASRHTASRCPSIGRSLSTFNIDPLVLFPSPLNLEFQPVKCKTPYVFEGQLEAN